MLNINRWQIMPVLFLILTVFILSIYSEETTQTNNININNIRLGKLVTGKEITSIDDLKGYVVGIQFWVAMCPLCQGAMPNLTKIYEKYNSDGFILLGFHIPIPEENQKNIMSYCKSLKTSFPVYEGGKISGLDCGLPQFVLFDHKGTMIYNGPMQDLDIKIAAAIKNAPHPIIGDNSYLKLNKLSEKAKENKDLGQILLLLKTKYLNSANTDEKLEAEKLIGCITNYGNELLAIANKKRDAEPLNAYNRFQTIANLFKGDEIGNNTEIIIKDLKNDNNFQDNIKADRILLSITSQIEAFKSCSKCKIFNKDCEECQKKNPSFIDVTKKAQELVKLYPDSPAAKNIRGIISLNK
jgi:hypothetical protein